MTTAKILWMKWMLVDVSVAEKADKDGKKALEVFMPSYLPGRPRRSDRRIMTPDDAKMVLELVKVRPAAHPPRPPYPPLHPCALQQTVLVALRAAC